MFRLTCTTATMVALSLLLARAHAEERAGQEPAQDDAHGSKVLASFEGGQITVGDLEDSINQQSPLARARYKDDKTLEELLRNRVNFELLAREAERRGYGEREKVVLDAKQAMVQAFVKGEFDDPKGPETISDEEIEQYYQEHLDEFDRPALRRASQIVVDSKKKAAELLTKAKKADVRGFRKLAREHSIDEDTKKRSGDLRYFDDEGERRGKDQPKVPAVLVRAAFRLEEVGDVAPKPIKVEQGWSILKLTGKRPANKRTLEEVTPTIRQRLWQTKRQDSIEARIDKVREQLQPEVHAERLEWIELEEPEDQKKLGPGFPKKGAAAKTP